MRLFLSVDLPKKIKSNIFDVSREFGENIFGNSVSEKNIHLTLKFLGYVDEKNMGKIRDELSKIKFNKFQCKLIGVGAFPSKGSPRVLWVGVEQGYQELIDLSKKINSVLKSIGFELDKRFNPHATFYRIKSVNYKENLVKLFNKYKSKDFGEFTAEKFALIESKLSRSGPTYSVVKEFNLSLDK